MPRAPTATSIQPMTPGSALVTGKGAGRARVGRKSRWPARLDWVQSVSGLILALFMWGHMFFVSSILLGKDAMWIVTRFFEGYFILGRSYPWIVSIAVAGVLTIVLSLIHISEPTRRTPISYAVFCLK